MTEIITFASGSPWLAFFLAWLVLWFVARLLLAPFNLVFRCWSRWLRSRNIAARGWPPAHLDADGDFKPEDKG